MRFLTSPKRGFTLVEIVVVAGIIGILAAVVIANVSSARAKARDTQRKSDLQQIQLALRLYKDAHGVYPSAGCSAKAYEVINEAPVFEWASPGPARGNTSKSCDDYIPGLVPSYIQVLPNDPMTESEENKGYSYVVSVDGKEYKFMARQSAEGGPVINGEPFSRCPANCDGVNGSPCTATNNQSANYAVYSSGAACW